MELGLFAADGRRLLFLFLVGIYGLLYLSEEIWQERAVERLSCESFYTDLPLVLGGDHRIFNLGVSVPMVCNRRGQDPAVILTSIFLVPNPEWQDPFLIVAWSLEYTIYFYLMFSLLFINPRFIGKALFVGWGVFSFFGATGIVYIDHFLFDFLFVSYNFMFIAGVVCAWLILNVKIPLSAGYLFMVLGLLGFPITWMNALNPFMEISFETSASVSIMLLLIGLGAIDLKKDIHIPNALHQLGNAAFAIYLVHNVVLDLFAELMDQAGLHEVVGDIGMSLILVILMMFFGVLAHFKLELPLHRIFKGWLQQNKAPVVAPDGTDAATKNT